MGVSALSSVGAAQDAAAGASAASSDAAAVELPLDRSHVELTLSPDVVVGLAWQRVGDHDVCFVDGVVVDTGIGAVLVPAPESDASKARAAARARAPFLLGSDTLPLPALKIRLEARGVPAVFSSSRGGRGGQLACDEGRVVVKKDADGALLLEGQLSETYFTVRDTMTAGMGVL